MNKLRFRTAAIASFATPITFFTDLSIRTSLTEFEWDTLLRIDWVVHIMFCVFTSTDCYNVVKFALSLLVFLAYNHVSKRPDSSIYMFRINRDFTCSRRNINERWHGLTLAKLGHQDRKSGAASGLTRRREEQSVI